MVRSKGLGWVVHAPLSFRRSSTRWFASASSSSSIGTARKSDPDAVAVVVGASRGIGLAATQALFRRFSGKIMALCRDPESAGALNALTQFDANRLRVAKVDIADEASVVAAAESVREFGKGRVDLLFNTVGLLHQSGHMPETSLAKLDSSFALRNFEVRFFVPH